MKKAAFLSDWFQGAVSVARLKEGWQPWRLPYRQLDMTALGYDGQCHMNTLITMMIRDLPARLIMLKLGINMMTGSYNARSFEPAVIGFVRILREGHPWIPIGLVSSI